jgi:hypothetical protein
MAAKKDRKIEERPIHVSTADEVVSGQTESVHSRDGSVHGQDGSEQRRLDDVRRPGRGRSAKQKEDESTPKHEIGQFTGEGRPSQQKK